MRTWFVIGVLMLAAPAHAAGLGDATCVQLDRGSVTAVGAAIGWLAGWIDHDVISMKAEVRALTRVPSTDEIAKFLTQYCQKNPTDKLLGVAFSLEAKITNESLDRLSGVADEALRRAGKK
jgi:hypothetical protein